MEILFILFIARTLTKTATATTTSAARPKTASATNTSTTTTVRKTTVSSSLTANPRTTSTTSTVSSRLLNGTAAKASTTTGTASRVSPATKVSEGRSGSKNSFSIDILTSVICPTDDHNNGDQGPPVWCSAIAHHNIGDGGGQETHTRLSVSACRCRVSPVGTSGSR